MAKRNKQTAAPDQASRVEGYRISVAIGDYSANARVSAALNGLRGSIGNWPIYAAAAKFTHSP